MANAGIDQNSRASLTGISSVDGKTIVPLYCDPTTHRLLIDTAGSSNIIIGTSTITSGSNGKILYDNNGVVGELTNNFEVTTNKATDFTTINNTLYPTVQAVNNQIITSVTGLLDYRGSYNASVNTFPATGGSGTAGAILKGDFWICSVAGTLGGTSVTPGDLIIALVDTPGQTASNWDLIQHDINGAYLMTNGSVTGATSQAQVFTNTLQITALTASQAVVTDASKNLVSLAYTNLNTGSTIVSRDTNGNANFVNVISTTVATATSGQTIALTAGSARIQEATGTLNITYNLPDATTGFLGTTYEFNNDSTGTITVYKNDGTTLITTVPSGGYMIVICSNNSTTNGLWDYHFWLANNVQSGTSLTAFNSSISGTTSTFNQTINAPNTVTVSSNAGTVPITYRINNFTNSSASAMTITMSVTSAVDGQQCIVRIYDASGATKGITWVNTENSANITAPATSAGSTTIPLTVGFIFNGVTSKWTCEAYS